MNLTQNDLLTAYKCMVYVAIKEVLSDAIEADYMNLYNTLDGATVVDILDTLESLYQVIKNDSGELYHVVAKTAYKAIMDVSRKENVNVDEKYVDFQDELEEYSIIDMIDNLGNVYELIER